MDRYLNAPQMLIVIKHLFKKKKKTGLFLIIEFQDFSEKIVYCWHIKMYLIMKILKALLFSSLVTFSLL